MNNKQHEESPSGGMTVEDILYVIFRHKWMIALISSVGVVAAAVLPLIRPIPYKSQAALLVKYVLEGNAPGPLGAKETGLKPVDPVESVINTELEILTSLDLAYQVATNIGPERILAGVGGGDDPYDAANLIQKNLVPEVPKRGNVIRIAFQHPSRDIVQPVLNQIVQAYLNKHRAIHGFDGNFSEMMRQQTEELALRMQETEKQLSEVKAKVGVISLDESIRVYSVQLSNLRQAIMETESALAERKSMLEEMEKMLPQGAGATTNSVAVTNAATATNVVAVLPETVDKYKEVCVFLDMLRKQEKELRLAFKPESSVVTEKRHQIEKSEKDKKDLEIKNPGLLTMGQLDPSGAGAVSSGNPQMDLARERAVVKGTEAKIKVLKEQLEKLQKEARAVSESEGRIKELETEKATQIQQYKLESESLAQAQVVAMGSGKLWNITPIQSPSRPVRVPSKLYKMMGMLLFGGVGVGIALAFLIELYVDRSLKRPIEVEARLGLPLFISIPRMRSNGKLGGLKEERKVPLLSQNIGESDGLDHSDEALEESGNQMVHLPGTAEVAPWDAKHELRPFSEALRDRLITYFEVNNVTRKPKLVAVTSCAEGAGVSTVAAGLAASLSETGDGKVLLVDMNGKTGETHQFFKGNLSVLEDAIEVETRDNALVQDNLYVATESMNDDNLPRVLPKRFKNLVGRLHASDFDYIIFDMPQVSQVSVTPRLARFMDMVLLVVESEKTNRDVVKRASSMLSESKANVSVVLNKEQTHVPKWLQQGH